MDVCGRRAGTCHFLCGVGASLDVHQITRHSVCWTSGIKNSSGLRVEALPESLIAGLVYPICSSSLQQGENEHQVLALLDGRVDALVDGARHDAGPRRA